jgi:hypothetical protein
VCMRKLRTSTWRKLLTVSSLLLILAMSATTALAGSPRFSKVLLSSGSLIAQGDVVGLTSPATVHLEATGSMVCDDETVEVTAEDSQTVTPSAQGKASFSLHADVDGGCDDDDDEDSGSVTWTSINLTLEQGSQTLDQREFSDCKNLPNGKIKCKKVHPNN